MSEAHTRQEMLRFARLCYERNLLVAMDGNLSVLLPDGNILCTQAGCHKGMLTDADLVVIDLDRPWRIDPDRLISKSKNSPFDGHPVQGNATMTVVGRRTVFADRP